MTYSTCKEYPKLALPHPPKKKKLKGYLPVTITCKNLTNYLDEPGIDIVHTILENRGAWGLPPPSPPPLKKNEKKIL